MVTLEETGGKTAWGKLRLEHTGLEFIYSTKHKDKSGHLETSYILYKQEYPNMQALIRFHDELNEHRKKEREKELKKTYHPTAVKRFKRKIQNLFKTVRDSLIDVLNMVIGRFKSTTSMGTALTSQDKYISRLKQEALGYVGTSYQPLLERHIGKRVVLELKRADEIFELPGVLKEYTADFIEVMDVDYKIKDDLKARKADLVMPRQYGVIRHLGE